LDEHWEDSKESALLPGGWQVLFLANGFTAVPEASGGTKHFLELARHWLAEGQALSVMTPDIGIENCGMERFSGPFLRLPGRWADRLPVAAMYLVRAATAVLFLPRGRSRLCLYGTSDMIPDVLPAFAYRALRRRSSFWVNCVFHLVPPPGKRAGSKLTNYASFIGQKAALLLIKLAADMLVVDNEILKGQLVDLGFEAARVFVTYMGTDGQGVFTDAAPAYDACFLGRLHPSKGIYDLVRIWGRVCERRPGSRLAVVGSGPASLFDKLDLELERQGLQGAVDLLGYISREELNEVLAGSKVFVFPSHEEGFGISIMEAMAFGLPVVAYELPHYRGIFKDSLSAVPLGDIDSFSAEVIGLLEDEARRERAGHQARALASRYTWRNVTLREAKAIARALEDARGR
jgi:glycosyltransferase involved in cell wall biosynthesis